MPGLAQTPFSRTKFPSIPIPPSHLRPIRTPFESLLHKEYLDKLSQVAVTCTVNIGFQPAPSSHSGTRPLFALHIPPRPRTLRALCVSAFCSPNLSLFNFKLLALFTLKNEGSVVEGSTARPEHSRRVNCFPSNSHRITSFAHPHCLTPIESYSCKKQGGRGPPNPNRGRRASGLCATRRNPPNFNLFMGLLHNSRTPPGGGLGQKKKQGTMNRATTREVVSFMWKSYPPSGSPTLRESTRELTIRKPRGTAR
jgi:hypothetical protein